MQNLQKIVVAAAVIVVVVAVVIFNAHALGAIPSVF
jgi:hypothetical protein